MRFSLASIHKDLGSASYAISNLKITNCYLLFSRMNSFALFFYLYFLSPLLLIGHATDIQTTLMRERPHSIPILPIGKRHGQQGCGDRAKPHVSDKHSEHRDETLMRASFTIILGSGIRGDRVFFAKLYSHRYHAVSGNAGSMGSLGLWRIPHPHSL